MQFSDIESLFHLCLEARDKFPEAWRVFFMEFSEPVEARREAFGTLLGYVNSHLLSRAPGIPTQIPEHRRNFISLALASFLDSEHLTQDFLDRCFKDFADVDDRLEYAPIPDLADDLSLASLLPPAPQPAATATLSPDGTITIECPHGGYWAIEILVNYGDDNTWKWMGMTSQSKWSKFSDPQYFSEEDQPATPPTMWRYRVRFRQNATSDPAKSKAVGLWSEEIPVRLAGAEAG